MKRLVIFVWWKVLIWSARLTLLFLAILTLLPMIPWGQWWIRIWDFPRLQIAISLLVPLGLTTFWWWQSRPKNSPNSETAKKNAWRLGSLTLPREPAILWGATLAVLAWQTAKILPFTPLWSVEVPKASSSTQGKVRLLTANINYHNNRHDEVLRIVQDQQADLILLLEVDQEWADALAPLDETHPHRIGVVRGEGLGIVLWSRFPFQEREVKYLVSERRASIFVTLNVPGFGPLRYVGLHPTPPGLKDRIDNNDLKQERRDSRIRDAELVLVARHIQQDPDQRWIVTGDFNDVAWSDITRLFQDLSDLKDPRVGRQFLNTYHAQWPIWRYPIDHVFVSDGLHLLSMKRIRVPGSDHFAITADFAIADKDQLRPQASPQDQKQAQEIVEEGAEDAKNREVKEND